MPKSEAKAIGMGTKIAQDLNTAIDNVEYFTPGEMQEHLMAIQPDRNIQKLWDSAPALLEALENLVSVCEGTGRQPPCIENAKTAKPSSPPSESRGRRVAFWCGC